MTAPQTRRAKTISRHADLKQAVRFNAVLNSKQESMRSNPFLRRLLLNVAIVAVPILLTFLYRYYTR
jgi:hypothetical protein